MDRKIFQDVINYNLISVFKEDLNKPINEYFINSAFMILNFEPKINMSDGLFDFFTWSNIQEIESDNYLKTELELKNNGLMNSN